MTVTIIENFEQDIKDFIFFDLNPDENLKTKLINKDLNELIIIHSNWSQRTVSPRPRQVHYSSEIYSNQYYNDKKTVIEILKQKFLAGNSIRPYLSRGIKNIFIENDTSSSSDKDLMLNEWGIHHLHLGENLEPDGFIERTPAVLFCKIMNNDVYFIDILDHGNGHLPWTEKKLLEIIQANWPELMKPYEMKDVIDLSYHASNEDHHKLRRSGISTNLKIGDKFYSPPTGGITLNGYSMLSSLNIILFRKLINANKKDFQKYRYEIQKFILDVTKIKYNLLKFKLLFSKDGWYYLELNSNTRIDITDSHKQMTIILQLQKNVFCIQPDNDFYFQLGLTV